MRPSTLMKVLTPYGEWLWAMSVTADTAKILSVPMLETSYGFYDIVRFEAREKDYAAIEITAKGGYALHIVRGPEVEPGPAMALMEHCREADMIIEIWSMTLNPPEIRPPSLTAGLVVPPTMDALEALLRLRRAAQLAGVSVSAPTLSKAAGDEVSVARDKRILRRIGAAA